MTVTFTKQNAITAAIMDIVASTFPVLNLLHIVSVSSDAAAAIVLLVSHVVLLGGLLFSGTLASSVVPPPLAPAAPVVK